MQKHDSTMWFSDVTRNRTCVGPCVSLDLSGSCDPLGLVRPPNAGQTGKTMVKPLKESHDDRLRVQSWTS